MTTDALCALVAEVLALEQAATPGRWRIQRGGRRDSIGRQYGFEVVSDIPADQQRRWETAGWVLIADIFHPDNPIDFTERRADAEIMATREANGNLIARYRALAPQLARALAPLLRVAEAAERIADAAFLTPSEKPRWKIAKGKGKQFSDAITIVRAALAALEALDA